MKISVLCVNVSSYFFLEWTLTFYPRNKIVISIVNIRVEGFLREQNWTLPKFYFEILLFGLAQAGLGTRVHQFFEIEIVSPPMLRQS